MTRLWLDEEAMETWDDDGTPAGFVWEGTPHRIKEICNRWRVRIRRWGPDEILWREYLQVTTADGFLRLTYHDLIDGSWFLSRLYD